jgi:hypothetical protein
MFAWVLPADAAVVSAAMAAEFARHGIEADYWTVPVQSDGARVIDD